MVADPTYGRVLLSPLVPRFLEAFAHVPLEVALDAQQLAAGSWEVAIRTRPPEDESVHRRLLGRRPRFYVRRRRTCSSTVRRYDPMTCARMIC